MKNNKKLIIVFFSDQNSKGSRTLIEHGWGFAESLFQEFSLEIDKSSFGFICERSKMKSHNLYDFKRSKKKAHQENEKSNLLYAHFYSLPKTYSTDPYVSVSFDWLMELQCGHASKPGIDYVQLGIDTTVAGIIEVLNDARSFERLCSRVFDLLPQSRYGAASILPSKYGPAGYSIGLPGGAPDEYIWDVNAWGGRYGVKFDKLRSVHGYNFLCQSLMEQPIGSVALKNWIFSSDAERGRISQFSSHLCLWKLTQGENLLHDLDWDNAATVCVRKELQDLGAFAWQDWLKRKR